MTVHTEIHNSVLVVTIDRPERRNAVDGPTATELFKAFPAFEEDDSLSVAILAGVNGTFCAGADLKAISTGNGNQIDRTGPGPMVPTRRQHNHRSNQ